MKRTTLKRSRLKSKRSKACDIKNDVRLKVFARDNYSCVICGSNNALPNAHVIPRSKGGLGVEKNIVTLCPICHQKLDNSIERKSLMEKVKKHLSSIYGDINDEEIKYKKGG